MGQYTGKVNRIDVFGGNKPRCLAFVNKNFPLIPNDMDYIQVETSIHSLQTVLELSCILKVEVDVHYEDVSGDIKTLTRVTILDRK
jgi:hypothetical protein